MDTTDGNGKLPVSPTQRRARVVALIQGRQFASVEDLSERFKVSVVTVRGDLDALAREGKLRRIRGGAVARAYRDWSITYDQRAHERLEEKQLIAAAAVEMLSDHESVILDGGSTTMEIARVLGARQHLRDLVVVTNGLNIASELERAEGRFEVVMTGGTLQPGQHSLLDPMAGLVLQQIKATTLFLGCNGIDTDGNITTPLLAEREMKKLMISAAQRRVVVADSSKFGTTSLARVCDVEDIDLVLTAGEPDPHILDVLESRGVQARVLHPG